MAAKAPADPPMVCNSHCQGHANESPRPEVTTAARATADPPISYGLHITLSGTYKQEPATRSENRGKSIGRPSYRPQPSTQSIQGVLGDKRETSRCVLLVLDMDGNVRKRRRVRLLLLLADIVYGPGGWKWQCG